MVVGTFIDVEPSLWSVSEAVQSPPSDAFVCVRVIAVVSTVPPSYDHVVPLSVEFHNSSSAGLFPFRSVESYFNDTVPVALPDVGEIE